jgi:hypothetical protein
MSLVGMVSMACSRSSAVCSMLQQRQLEDKCTTTAAAWSTRWLLSLLAGG